MNSQKIMLWPILVFMPALCSASDGPWVKARSECHNVHTPGFDSRYKEFKATLETGKAWDKKVDAELVAISSIINTTCKDWARSPNGDSVLAKFLSQYSGVASTAVDLQRDAQTIFKFKFDLWEKLQEAEVSKLTSDPSGLRNLDWHKSFKCSKSFDSVRAHVASRSEELLAAVNTLKKECPKIDYSMADKKTETKLNVRSGPPSLKFPKEPSRSDISGTKEQKK